MRSDVRAIYLLLALSGCAPSELDHEPSTAEQPPLVTPRGAPLSLESTPVSPLEARGLIEQQLSLDPANLRLVEGADGVRRLRVASGFQHATVIVRNADGTRARHCVDRGEQALRLLDEVKR